MKINTISKDINKAFDKKEVRVHSDITGKDYPVVIDKKFKKTKLVNMCLAIGERAEMCRENGIVFDFALCQWAMMLASFTDLKFDTGKDLMETYLKECIGVGNLIDAEILDKLLLEFDESELNKITETSKAMGNFTKRVHDIEIDTAVDKIVGEDDGDL